DIKVLWDSLINMFEHDRSAARGLMATRRLIVFKHDTSLGNAPAHELFELVNVKRKTDPSIPARDFGDYEIMIERGKVPAGVTFDVKG
ncbi:MAG: type I CRISPR-associated protein Cas7, partial [Syntrophales bacterium]|nr:type I CRISPR-associated protein Cas7 [Syntrophales bacterium]